MRERYRGRERALNGSLIKLSLKNYLHSNESFLSYITDIGNTKLYMRKWAINCHSII